MKKTLKTTYSDIRSAIAFIMRNERGLSKHAITEAALAATKVLHGRDVQSFPEKQYRRSA